VLSLHYRFRRPCRREGLQPRPPFRSLSQPGCYADAARGQTVFPARPQDDQL